VGLKTYRGIREPLCHVRVLEGADPAPLPPPPSPTDGAHPPAEHELTVPRELVHQALVPFDWGADGPGTHYLAVALLADLLGPGSRGGIKAVLPFMRRFLSRLPKDDFEISETVFRAFLHAVSGSTVRPPAAPPPLPGKAGSAGAHEELREGTDKGQAAQHPTPESNDPR
jgi:uncharacterized protein DUF6166